MQAETLPKLSKLRIRLVRLSKERHRIEIVRPDGRVEARTLETRSFLAHDLVHFAVESEAGLVEGFYGRLARGASLDDPPASSSEAMMIETIVGPFQSALGKEAPQAPEDFVASLAAYLAQSGKTTPAWLTPDYAIAVRERLRKLMGQWKATPFGETMELAFP